MNNGKKFDVCLQNPPYSTTNDALHLQFVDKIQGITNMLVVVMPFSFVTKHGIKKQDDYKKKLEKYIEDIEEVPGDTFSDTKMPNVAIYKLLDNEVNNIKISYLNGTTVNVKSLLAIDNFSQYEKQIEYYFKNFDRIPVVSLGYMMPTKHLKDKGIINNDEINKRKEDNAINCVKNIPENKVYLICNSINGGMNAKFFTNKNGQILDGINKLIDYVKNTDNVSNGYNCAIFNSIKAAHNCKIAMTNELMRFLLYKILQDQRMTPNKCYRYVPNIDWEDDRVLTDEGLLEVCGCPKDKAKEYAEYCKKYIEENVDKYKN